MGQVRCVLSTGGVLADARGYVGVTRAPGDRGRGAGGLSGKGAWYP